LFSFDFTELKELRDSGADEDDYRSHTFGKFYLEGGSDELLDIKNKEYKIQIINVYNNEQQTFTIIPRSNSSQIDESKEIEQQSPN